MDTAKALVRSVARTFYGTQYVLVVDALMVHSALQNEDLAFVVNMHNKELRDLCGTLRLDRMLAVHSRAEIREGQQRPINKDYYYIDFHATIDAIKYRVYHLEQRIKEMYDPNEEKKDYFCPRCKMQYTQIDVLPLLNANHEFDCGRCGNLLEREERGDGASTGTEMSTRSASQMKPFVDMLRKIDNEVIPANDFDTAFSMAIPVQRNEDTYSKATTVPVEAPKGLPSTVKGMTQVSAGPLDVTVTSNAERTAAEKAAEVKRKAAIAAQNTLPEWHVKSTVTGESVAVRKASEQVANGVSLAAEEEEDQKDGNNLDDELTAYYAQMAEEAEIEKAKEDDPDSEDEEEEEEDDFEEVGLKASAVGTPSSSMSADPIASRAGESNGTLKRKESESGSSAPITNTNTPAASGPVLEEEEGPAAKKVKFEAHENGTANINVETSAVEKPDNDSDEDEADFENAL